MSDFEKWWENHSLLTHPSNKKIVAQNAYEAGKAEGFNMGQKAALNSLKLNPQGNIPGLPESPSEI